MQRLSPTVAAKCPKRREGGLEHRKNKRDRVHLFRLMVLPCFLCFDGLLVGGQVQFIEEEEDGALKRIEDISGISVEGNKNTILRN